MSSSQTRNHKGCNSKIKKEPVQDIIDFQNKIDLLTEELRRKDEELEIQMEELWSQNEELAVQREELESQNEELKANNEAQEIQVALQTYRYKNGYCGQAGRYVTCPHTGITRFTYNEK